MGTVIGPLESRRIGRRGNSRGNLGARSKAKRRVRYGSRKYPSPRIGRRAGRIARLLGIDDRCALDPAGDHAPRVVRENSLASDRIEHDVGTHVVLDFVGHFDARGNSRSLWRSGTARVARLDPLEHSCDPFVRQL